MGHTEENVAALAPHEVAGGQTADNWAIVAHKGATDYLSWSPDVQKTAAASMVDGAETSKSDMEDAMPPTMKTWYDALPDDDVRDAVYRGVARYRDL